MSNGNSLRAAERERKDLILAEAKDSQTWKCASCSKMIEDGHETYCRSCGQYWEDVSNGLFQEYE